MLEKKNFGSDWVGFKNFEYLFKTDDAWIITRNTIGYNFAFIIINTCLAITVAIILSELHDSKLKKVLSKCYSSSFFLISTVIISYLVFAFQVLKTVLSINQYCLYWGWSQLHGMVNQNTGLLY